MFRKILITFLTLIFFVKISEAIPSFLPAEKAFQLSVKMENPNTVLASWELAPSYYLYKDSFKFEVISPSQTKIKNIIFPSGVIHSDEVRGLYEAYENNARIQLILKNPSHEPLTLAITYQGCTQSGLCYPAVTQQTTLNPSSQNMMPLSSYYSFWSFIGFLTLGILLSFTPCVLPMVPILSSILLGSNNHKTLYAFKLSFTYVLSMAITYAIAGILAGYSGHYLQATFQSPWYIGILSFIFILLALSLFGLYELRLPHFIQERVLALSNRQKGGTYVGVAAMGCLATLIVSPCVTPPLVGVLGFISKTGDLIVGGLSLFMVGLGMGIPLLIFGTFGGKLLPKTGIWMKSIKVFFGISMIVMSANLMLRILPPLTFLQAKNTTASIPFKRVKSVAELRQMLQQARQQNQSVMLDFYADWCHSCIRMDRYLFTHPQVQAVLKSKLLLRADITANNSIDKELLDYFKVLGPPTMLFLDRQGNEISAQRIVGEVGVSEFLNNFKKSDAHK